MIEPDVDLKEELRRAHARIVELESKLYRHSEMVSTLAGRLFWLEAAEVERQRDAARVGQQWTN